MTVHNLFGRISEILKLFLLLFCFLSTNTWAAKKPYIVVLDPGHGGKDKGATIYFGKGKNMQELNEKNIVLQLAKNVGRILEDPEYWAPLNRKITVLYTRDRDKDMALEDRARLARNKKAALFVSIHVNADKTGTAHGFETYFLNNAGKATNRQHLVLNLRQKKGNPLDLLLRSVSTDSNMERSRLAAINIQQSVTKIFKKNNMKVRNRGVRQEIFQVLTDTQTPSVLLEALFLSNKKDQALLLDKAQQAKLSKGIAQGILRFLSSIE